MLSALSGCGKNNVSEQNIGEAGKSTENSIVEQSETTEEETFTEAPLDISKPDDIAKIGTPFLSPFEDGNMYYTIDDCKVYQTLEEAGLEKEDFIEPYSNYADRQYWGLSSYILEDGSIEDTHQLLILDLTIKNESAMGHNKKDEFGLGGLVLFGGDPANMYCMSYFKEAGKANQEQSLHFKLGQGEEMHTQIGYFVRKDDMDSLVGIINKNEERFMEVYFEVTE